MFQSCEKSTYFDETLQVEDFTLYNEAPAGGHVT